MTTVKNNIHAIIYPQTKSLSSSTHTSSSTSTQSLSSSKRNPLLYCYCSRLLYWLQIAVAVTFFVSFFRDIGIIVPAVDAFSPSRSSSSSSSSSSNSKHKPTSNKRHTHIGMPPLTISESLNTVTSDMKEFKSVPLSASPHTSNFAKRINHPAAYEESPTFKGPLLLPKTISTSEHRIRVRNYYQEHEHDGDKHEHEHEQKNRKNRRIVLPSEDPKPLKINASTDTILQKIMDNFAYRDAPVDIKELAESMEFYLRTRKRLISAANNKLKRNRKLKLKLKLNERNDNEDGNDNTKNNKEREVVLIRVYDLCAGHGLTGMLFAACNPPKVNVQNNVEIRVETHLVDVVEPPSHTVLKELIGEVCPWIYDTYTGTPARTSMMCTDSEEARSDATVGAGKNNGNDNASAIHFHESPLEAFVPTVVDESVDDCVNVVISTHACGSLTDLVLETATSASAPASMSTSSTSALASPSVSASASLQACAIASMPCCYTGTDKGMPYGIKRAMGVAWAADLRRTMKLEERGYRTDYTCIPVEITPLNRIILGEERV